MREEMSVEIKEECALSRSIMMGERALGSRGVSSLPTYRVRVLLSWRHIAAWAERNDI